MDHSSQNRLWVLSELYHPEDSATGYYVTKIAEALAYTHRVSVLSAQPTYTARGTKAPKDEVLNNVHVHRCAATTLNKDVLPFRILNLFTISTSIFLNALWNLRQGDVVLVVTNPPTLPFVALLACALRRAKLILRIEDVYPEAMIAAGMVSPRSLLVRILNPMHRWIYRRADRVTVLGRDMLSLVQGKMKGAAEHVTIITNWGDADQVKPGDRDGNSLLRDCGLLEKFVVQYSGNMGRTHDLESLVEVAARLVGNPSIHFLFIGTGAKEPWLRNAVQARKLPNVTILPPQPRTNLMISLNACDLAVITLVRGMAGVSVPSRLYNILSAGKPILAAAESESELARMILEKRVGWVVQPESSAQISEAILKAAADQTLLGDMSRRARTLIEAEYSQSTIIAAFETLLRSFGARTERLQERAS